MGRKAKLLGATTKNYTKEEIEEKKKQEEVLYTFERLDFNTVPNTLGTLGVIEWHRLGSFFGELPVSELDRALVTNYCMYVELLEKAREQLKGEPLTFEGKKNPLIDIINTSNRELKSLASSMGLTIDSRMKIKAPKKEAEQDDFFGELLKKADGNE